jgi:MATE family multidrug resistance protein
VTIVVANLSNAVLNYAWIFGKLGLPAHGVYGSAYATSVSRWLMPALLLLLAWPHLERYLRPLAPRVLAAAPVGRMFLLGAPIGGQMMLEVGAFSAVAMLMGWLGVEAVAAHQIAINLASLTFMVPLGVGSAAAVIVGRAVGRGDHAALKRAATAALAAGAAFMGLTGAAFVGLPRPLAGLYTNAVEVVALAVVLLPIAGVFQVFDGLQAVAIGVLRGLGDTRVPLVANAVGFWVIGLPVSLLLGFGWGLGARGLWWGLVVGLVMVASFLLLRVAQRLRHAVPRVVIDEPST